MLSAGVGVVAAIAILIVPLNSTAVLEVTEDE
jgi:hypothetical protein